MSIPATATHGIDFVIVWDSLWRTKKSHFQPSEEMRMRNVDKDEVITKIGLILVSTCIKILKIDAYVHFKNFNASR